ncbi:MAG: Fe-S cluster assembly protein SufD [Bacteroidetes bacterium]|nr:Fe-S cluster assembly protein SufD [Bacteroidota bacterium]
MESTTNIGFKENLLESFRIFERQLNGQSTTSMHAVRRKAMEAFERMGLPHAKHEEYKYTQIGKLLEKEFILQPIHLNSNLDSVSIKPFLIEQLDANVLVFVNGEFNPALSSIISPDNEVSILEFTQAYQKDPGLLDQHFAQYANFEGDSFTALNTAFAQQGMVINVPKKQVVQKPIVFYHISDTRHGNTLSQPRNLVIAEESSQLSVIEIFQSLGENTSFTNVVSEILVNKNAEVDYYKIDQEGNKALQVGNTQVYQDRDSRFNSVYIALSGRMVRNNLNIVLDAEGCETHLYGLYLVKGTDHIDNHTVVDHKKPNSYSNELYKGIMDEKATGVFNGKIYVRPDAQKTNAYQSNNNILLSDEASINTKPQLEIWADDVKCSHGATTGQLDEEQLFYLRARGLDKTTARAMLLYAFAMDVIENIKIPVLREHMEKIIAYRLHNEY